MPSSRDVVIETIAGPVRGELRPDGVQVFRGIPYAEPPIGPLRFAASVPVEPWTEPRDATSFGPTVPQGRVPEPFGTIMAPVHLAGEDCLSLNVWAPAARDDGGRPVLVWIHGGGFLAGSGSDPHYDGSSFARDGVVCVTFNYRVGALGFLRVPGVTGSGNAGLLDQVAVLRWVQENIAAFGGDPGLVTIAGESAGAQFISALMAMPAASGLFQRAVMSSGSPRVAVSTSTADEVVLLMADHLGIDRDDTAAWQALGTERLLTAQAEVTAIVDGRLPGTPAELACDAIPTAFRPVYGTAELPTRPLEAIRAGAAAGVPCLIGGMGEEFRCLFDDVTLPEEYLRDMVALGFGAGAEGRPADVDTVIDTYRTHRSAVTNADVVSAVMADWMFGMPSSRLADAQAEHAEVYAYRVDWALGRWGASHTVDIVLAFDTLDTDSARTVIGDVDATSVAAVLHGAWVEFVRTGVPVAESAPDATSWPRYDTSTRRTLVIDRSTHVENDPRAAERQLWDVTFLG